MATPKKAKTKTRGKGEGAIYQNANGLWTATIELPPVDGTRRRKVIRSKDKNVVIKKMADAKTLLSVNGDLPSDSQTVEQWFGYWLENLAVRTVRPKTLGGYRSVIKMHVNPVIGKVPLTKLTPAHIRRVTDKLALTHSSTYALNAHRVMSSGLTDAEREGRIFRNPAKLTKAPRKRLAELEVLTTAEAAQFIRQFGDDPSAFMWATFLLTGARRGELLGLTWDRVTDELELSWQLQRHTVGKDGGLVAPSDYEHKHLTGGLYLTRPKSGAGWRVVPLVDPLRSILQRWRLVAPANEYGLVFARPDGQPIDPDSATKAWPEFLAAAGITKAVRLHDLRHTAVDLLYEAGVPEVVIQEIVGHSSRSVTRGYKSRGNREQLEKAMLGLSTLLELQAPLI
jgi:integrase